MKKIFKKSNLKGFFQEFIFKFVLQYNRQDFQEFQKYLQKSKNFPKALTHAILEEGIQTEEVSIDFDNPEVSSRVLKDEKQVCLWCGKHLQPHCISSMEGNKWIYPPCNCTRAREEIKFKTDFQKKLKNLIQKRNKSLQYLMLDELQSYVDDFCKKNLQVMKEKINLQLNQKYLIGEEE